MKRLIPIFAIAALAGCDQAAEIDLRFQMETMMDKAPGAYTFLPHTDGPYDIPVKGTDLWDLVIKKDQYTKTLNADRVLCANFQVVTVNITAQGKYLLPYDRTAYIGQAAMAARQQTETALPDFKPETLLNIPTYRDATDGSVYRFRIMDKVREVCVNKPSVVQKP